jgi:hypothetical protein
MFDDLMVRHTPPARRRVEFTSAVVVCCVCRVCVSCFVCVSCVVCVCLWSSAALTGQADLLRAERGSAPILLQAGNEGPAAHQSG